MIIKYPELEEPCRTAIKEGICTGCNALELPYFRAKKNCKYAKIPTAEESIKRGKEILGVQEKLEL